MFTNTPRLRRSFVGYSKKEVQQVLDEQDTMLRRATQVAEDARADAARLEAEIAQLRQDAETSGQEAQALRAEIQRITSEAEQNHQVADRYRAEADQYRAEADRVRAEAEAHRAEAERALQEAEAAKAPDRIAELLNEELAGVLAAARESAERIVDHAEESGKAREAQAEGVWEEVQAEVDRFTTWWERVEPIIREVQKRIEEARSRADEVADRIRQALGPTLQAMIDVDTDLGRLQDSATPPAVKTPGASQEDEDDLDGGAPYDASANGESPSTVVNVENPVTSEGGYDPDYWG